MHFTNLSVACIHYGYQPCETVGASYFWIDSNPLLFFDFQLSQADSGASLKELKLYPQETLTLEEKWVSHRDTAVVLDILSSVFSVTATAAAIPTVFYVLARLEGNGRSNWISFQAKNYVHRSNFCLIKETIEPIRTNDQNNLFDRAV